MRIVVYPKDKSGVGKFRSIDPHNNMSTKFTVDFNKNTHPSNLKSYDLVHFSTFFPINVIKKLKGKVKFVMDIDDYWETPVDSPFHGFYEKNKQEIIERIRLVDHITTTTIFLANKIRLINPNVTVIPNALNPSEKQFQPIYRDNHIIGWLGGSGHINDFKNINISSNNFDFIYCGGDTINIENMFGDNVTHIPFTNINEYAMGYNEFDISLAPLEYTEFNSCKSQLKVIEAGFMGKALIAQNFGPYTIDLIHEENALLVGPDNDWATPINRLINDVELKNKLSDNLSKLVRETYNIKKINIKRESLYESIMDGVPLKNKMIRRKTKKHLTLKEKAKQLYNRKNRGSNLEDNIKYIGDNRGVNVSGFLNGRAGLGEAARGTIKILQKITPLINLNNFNIGNDREDIIIEPSRISMDNPFAINLIHVNPNSFIEILSKFGYEYFHKKYNVGLWVWETDKIPTSWFEVGEFVDEIWVPSTFCKNIFKKAFPSKDIHIIPHQIEIPDKSLLKNKEEMGFDKNVFYFLYSFDCYSTIERKNPEGLIDVFNKAFINENVQLILKVSNGTEEYIKKLKEVGGDKLMVLTEYYSNEDFKSLLNSADCFISLHRSEGFGLHLAESMALGKPVIATNYGGNTEFMKYDNSFLVDYDMVDANGWYDDGDGQWAEPNVDDAISKMRFVYENKKETEEIAKVGFEYVKQELSSISIAENVNILLNNIRNKVGETEMKLNGPFSDNIFLSNDKYVFIESLIHLNDYFIESLIKIDKLIENKIIILEKEV